MRRHTSADSADPLRGNPGWTQDTLPPLVPLALINTSTIAFSFWSKARTIVSPYAEVVIRAEV